MRVQYNENVASIPLMPRAPCLLYYRAGFVIGALFASTVLGVISSAVNTVIVCYAEAPNEFQQNHPQLSEDMRLAWRQAWPQDFTY